MLHHQNIWSALFVHVLSDVISVELVDLITHWWHSLTDFQPKLFPLPSSPAISAAPFSFLPFFTSLSLCYYFHLPRSQTWPSNCVFVLNLIITIILPALPSSVLSVLWGGSCDFFFLVPTASPWQQKKLRDRLHIMDKQIRRGKPLDACSKGRRHWN